MAYIRILFAAFAIMYVAYYMLLFAHMFGMIELTKEKITFKKVLIPFYYLTKIS